MSDRAEREKQLDWLYRLKSDLKIFIPKDFHLAEFEQSLGYAISSIKTDLKYDLLYEGEDELCNGDCDNCDFVDGDYCRLNEKSIPVNLHPERNVVAIVPCGDIISRIDARKAILDHQYSDSFCEEHNIDHSINTGMALIALSDLPSVKLRKGQWLRMSDLSEKEDDRYQCSYCGNVVHYKSKMDLYTFNSWCGRCGCDNDWRKCIEGNER